MTNMNEKRRGTIGRGLFTFVVAPTVVRESALLVRVCTWTLSRSHGAKFEDRSAFEM